MHQFDVCCKQFYFYVKLIEHPPPNNPPSTNEDTDAPVEPNAIRKSPQKRAKYIHRPPPLRRRRSASNSSSQST